MTCQHRRTGHARFALVSHARFTLVAAARFTLVGAARFTLVGAAAVIIPLALSGCSSGSATTTGANTVSTSSSVTVSSADTGSSFGPGVSVTNGADAVPSSVPGAPSSPVASTSPTGSAAATYLQMELTRTSSAAGTAGTAGTAGRTVTVQVRMHGRLHQARDAQGKPIEISHELKGGGTAVGWGDGARGGGDGGGHTCSTTTPIVPVNVSYPVTHTYTKPGTYTFSMTVAACLPHPVTKILTITVR